MVASILAVPAIARSQSSSPQPTGNTEAAREWANKAKERFQAGDYAGAIEAVAEAEKHFRALTFTKLSAQAHDKLGKLIEARRLYQSIVDQPLDTGVPPAWLKAQEDAKQELGGLERRIPKLHLTVLGADVASLRVTVDGNDFDEASLGTPVAMNPGQHEIKVSVADREATVTRVLLKEGVTEFLSITLRPGLDAPAGQTPPVSVPTRQTSSVSALTVTGYVSLGIGGAGLVLGAVTGGLALAGRDEVKAACGAADFDAGRCETSRTGALDGAQAMARASTAGFVIAGVGAAAGAALLLLDLGKRPAAVSLGPGFVSLRGAF